MKTLKNRREGFSLIELIITIAIVGIVMSSVLLLISYSSNSMRRTTNTVNLQNETKDALLHLSTYVQEGSDAHWDADKKALIVVKKVKNLEGDPVSLEVSHYFFRADASAPVPSTDPGATPGPSASPGSEGDGTRGVICFYKHEPAYSISDSDWNSHFNDDGSINYATVAEDYDALTSGGVESLLFAKNVVEFTCSVNENTVEAVASLAPAPSTSSVPSASPENSTAPAPSTSPETSAAPGPVASATPAPTAASIGGKFVVITIDMKNENGDAQFKSSKEVYMRNR